MTTEARNCAGASKKFATQVIAPRAAAIDRTGEYPWDIVTALTEAGNCGMTIPRQYGGAGASYLDAVLVIEEMAKACTVTARIVVKRTWADLHGHGIRLRGAEGPGREDGAGRRQARDLHHRTGCRERRARDDHARGTKERRLPGERQETFDHGRGVSKLHLIFARVVDDKGRDIGVGGFLAVRDDSGAITCSRREPTMGRPKGELVFKDLSVPDDMVVRPPSGFGRGFADLMNAYNSQRVGAGTCAMGIAAGALNHALRWVRERRQFGRPIGEFQGLQWMLADMQIEFTAARLMLYAAAGSRGPNGSRFPDPDLAAQAKIFASESAITIVNDALQLFGARGYSRDFPLERMARDVRIFTMAAIAQVSARWWPRSSWDGSCRKHGMATSRT